MKSRKKHIVMVLGTFLVAGGIIAFLAKGLTLNPNAIQSPLIGKPAQEFHVPLIQAGGLIGSEVDLKDFVGKPLILNFWASWCTSCRMESKAIEAFWQQMKSEVQILGIAVHDEEENARAFAERFGKTYPLALDKEGDASLNYGVTGVPETIFIDKHGIVRHKEAGPVNAAMLHSYWNKIKG